MIGGPKPQPGSTGTSATAEGRQAGEPRVPVVGNVEPAQGGVDDLVRTPADHCRRRRAHGGRGRRSRPRRARRGGQAPPRRRGRDAVTRGRAEVGGPRPGKAGLMRCIGTPALVSRSGPAPPTSRRTGSPSPGRNRGPRGEPVQPPRGVVKHGRDDAAPAPVPVAGASRCLTRLRQRATRPASSRFLAVSRTSWAAPMVPARWPAAAVQRHSSSSAGVRKLPLTCGYVLRRTHPDRA